MSDNSDQVSTSQHTADYEWDWDAWVASRTNEHVEGILGRILDSPEAVAWRAAREAAARARVTIDPETGTMPAGLCWVCAASEVQQATKTTPTFRACSSCLLFDRAMASRLGLVMLLPLMDFAGQPVQAGQTRPTDRATVTALVKAWSEVSVLDAWRASVVRAVLAVQAWPAQEPITVGQLECFMPESRLRSHSAWWAYVDRHQPDLATVLRATDPGVG